MAVEQVHNAGTPFECMQEGISRPIFRKDIVGKEIGGCSVSPSQKLNERFIELFEKYRFEYPARDFSWFIVHNPHFHRYNFISAGRTLNIVRMGVGSHQILTTNAFNRDRFANTLVYINPLAEGVLGGFSKVCYIARDSIDGSIFQAWSPNSLVVRSIQHSDAEVLLMAAVEEMTVDFEIADLISPSDWFPQRSLDRHFDQMWHGDTVEGHVASLLRAVIKKGQQREGTA